MTYSSFLKLAAAAGLAFSAPAATQSYDPSDTGEHEPAAGTRVQASSPRQQPLPVTKVQEPAQVGSESEYQPIDPGSQTAVVAAQPAAPAQPVASAEERASAAVGKGVAKDNVLSAAEGVFGRGAEGLAGLLENILRKQGEPSAYITGSEAGGAVVVGLRYGKGTLHHKAEGDRPVYWTGPSVGLDFGGDANKVFVLVYNLDKSDSLFKRYGAAEGNAYVVGGFKASYMRHGDTVLIPIRTGVGVRMGVNAGYMKFTPKGTWLPF